MINQYNLPGIGLSEDHIVNSNFYADNFIVQQTAVVHPKYLLIDGLRKVFKKNNIYTYRQDEYGYPLIPDLTGMDPDTIETTRILISDSYMFERKFYPAIVVKFSGGSYKPNSFNQDMTLKYKTDIVTNVFGEKTKVTTPTHRVYTGKWDLSFDIGIYAESLTELNELIDIVSLTLKFTLWHDLRAAGLFISSLNISGENAEPYANDYIYSSNISIKTLSEWRAEIPIYNLVEKIVFKLELPWHRTSSDNITAEDMTMKFGDIIDIVQIT